MQYNFQYVVVEFVEISGKIEFTEFEGFAMNFLLSVPSRPPRSLPEWQRCQDATGTAAMSVNYCMHTS